jgi:opacity protein-like surface antigen
MNVRLRWAGAVVLVCAPARFVIAQEPPAEPGAEPPIVAEPPKHEAPRVAEPRSEPQSAKQEQAPVMAATTEEAAGAKKEPPALDHHRLLLGLMLPVGLSGGSSGALGGLTPPAAQASYETRMTGPAWFMVGARGSGERIGTDTMESGSWSFGGFTGVRLEAPVHEYVEVGGYGVFEAAGHEWSEGYGWNFGFDFGAGLHFRPTRLFGARLGVEVLKLGYEKETYLDQLAYRAYARLTASPSIELTFSFE